MKTGKLTTEHLFYGLVILLAVGLRFIGLGTAPLSDNEASNALQALSAFQPGHGISGAQPVYVLLTAASFFLIGSSEFFARFWPAVFGTLLVLVPYLGRERLGQKAALVMAFALAVEPSLVAASRQADGRMMAICGLAFALVFLMRRNVVWAGIAAGFAIFGGPTAWNGLLAIALGWGAFRLTRPNTADRPETGFLSRREFWFGLGGMVVFMGTLFGVLPSGLSSLANSLVVYFQGWATMGAGPVLLMLVAWVGLSPLAFLFGITRVFTGLRQKDPTDVALIWLWGFSLLLVCIYPARHPADVAWVAVPFLALAARQAARVNFPVENKLPAIGYAALVVVLFVSLGINFSGFFGETPVFDETLRVGGILGGVFLILASFGLMIWGWSWKVASAGALFGLTIFLLIYTLSSAWAGASLGRRPDMELWVEDTYPKDQALTMKVLGDVSEWNTGRRDWLDLVVSGIDTPSLRWGLRNYANVNYIDQLPQGIQPSVVITPESQGTNLGLASPYTGQALAWGHNVNWSLLSPGEWVRWLFYRSLPQQSGVESSQNIILWLRSDLFPGAAKTSANP
jgi:hypothetical protein